MKLRQLFEGGDAIKGVKPITQAEAQRVMPELIELISTALKIKKSEVAIVGSAGKKPHDDDLSGDIDFAVLAPAERVREALPKLSEGEANFREMVGLNVYAFSYRVGDDLIQVDLMPVDDLEYAKWSMHAHPVDLALGLKSATRNEAIYAVAKHTDLQATAVDRERYFYDLSRGLLRGNQTLLSNSGRVTSSWRTVGDKRVVTKDPRRIADLLFNTRDHEALTSFGGCWEAMQSPWFPAKKALPDIREMIMKGLRGKGLKLPEELS